MKANRGELLWQLRYSLDSIHGLPWIRHPLLNGAYTDQPELANQILREKLKAVKRAIAKRDWEQFILLHERPWRVQAFEEVAPKLTDAEYWRLLSFVWTDSEGIDEVSSARLLGSARPGREHLMDDCERRELGRLPETLTIYRGFAAGNDWSRGGWSWTLEKDIAEWFARRYALPRGTPRLVTGECDKADVLALLLDRKEKEIVIDPQLVRLRSETEIAAKPLTAHPAMT